MGYDDTDPENPYWIMVNSWGTAGGLRPNGIFRLNMNMDYSCVYLDQGKEIWNFYWQTMEVNFNITRKIIYVSSSGDCNDKTPCYRSVTEAVDNAGPVGNILITRGEYDEDIRVHDSQNLFFKGGYDPEFTTSSSNTTLNSLTVVNGFVRIENLILR